MPFNAASRKGKRDEAAGDAPRDGKSTFMSVVDLLLTLAGGVEEVPFLKTAVGGVQELIGRFEVLGKFADVLTRLPNTCSRRSLPTTIKMHTELRPKSKV